MRTHVGNVKQQISDDLNLTETQFSQAVSIFYIGARASRAAKAAPARVCADAHTRAATSKRTEGGARAGAGYILIEIPSNLMLKRVNPAYWYARSRAQAAASVVPLWRGAYRRAARGGRRRFGVDAARIGMIVAAFGLCSTSMIFVETFPDLLIVRAFLGLAEGGCVRGATTCATRRSARPAADRVGSQLSRLGFAASRGREVRWTAGSHH